MNKKILIVLGLTISLCILIFGVGFADSLVFVDDLGCDDLSYKWFLPCDQTNGMITTDPDHLLPSGGLHEFNFDGTPGFKSVMVGTSNQHTSFNANLFGGAVLTIIWTPGYSSVEQLQVTLDGITKNGRVIAATSGSNGQSDARFGAPGDLWYFTEVFNFGPLSGVNHSLNIRSNNGDGVGFDYIKLETPLLEVDIDIKPGSDPNCFNSNGHGVIPVAILSSPDFDASMVDPFSVSLDGAAVRVKGKSGTAGSLEDVNGDGILDLVVQIIDDSVYTGEATAYLSGDTYDGVPIVGSDSICLRPPE